MSLRQSTTTKKQKQIHLTTLATRNKSWGLGKHTLQKIESAGQGYGSILVFFFFKECCFRVRLTLTLTQILAPHFTDTRLVPCERSLRPHISKTLSSIFFVKFRKRLISSLKKRHHNRSFQSLYPVRDFPSIP